jgi:hypothetical protein
MDILHLRRGLASALGSDHGPTSRQKGRNGEIARCSPDYDVENATALLVVVLPATSFTVTLPVYAPAPIKEGSIGPR